MRCLVAVVNRILSGDARIVRYAICAFLLHSDILDPHMHTLFSSLT